MIIATEWYEANSLCKIKQERRTLIPVHLWIVPMQNHRVILRHRALTLRQAGDWKSATDQQIIVRSANGVGSSNHQRFAFQKCDSSKRGMHTLYGRSNDKLKNLWKIFRLCQFARKFIECCKFTRTSPNFLFCLFALGDVIGQDQPCLLARQRYFMGMNVHVDQRAIFFAMFPR